MEIPQFFGEYRPIYLILSVYKILSNILAGRLKQVVGKVISHSQTTFIPGRKFFNGVVLVNELIDYAK